MARKKKVLSDSAEAMTAELFGTSEKQEPEETKKAKIATAFPEGSAARASAEEREQMLKDGRAREIKLEVEDRTIPARTLNLEVEDKTIPARTLNLEVEQTTFPDKKQAKAQKPVNKKVTYGARISKDTITSWKAYIEASGKDAGACTEKALQEYMNRHKLTGIQKQIYDLKMRALDN